MIARPFTLALCAIAITASPALAELTQDAQSAAAPGQISFTYNRSLPVASPAERTPLQATGIKLRDMILATPALADRRGFALHASVVLQRPVASRASDPDGVWGNVLSRRINVARSKPDAAGRYPGDGEGPAISHSINKPEDALLRLGREADGFFTPPQDSREQGGVMRFSRSGRDYVVITPPGVPLFKPVSIGEYVTASADAFEKEGLTLAGSMRQALAQLTPAQQAQPYCETNTGPATDLANRCQHRSAKPVVRLNPNLWIGTGAASQPRLAILHVPQLGQIGDAQERRRLLTAFNQIDIAAVQALLRS